MVLNAQKKDFFFLGHFGPELLGFYWDTRYAVYLCDNVETH